MNKPYAYVMIPNIIHNNEDDEANTKQLIRELRTYGFNPSEDILLTNAGRAIAEIDEPEIDNAPDTRNHNLGQIIKDVQMELEAEEDANLSNVELLEKILNEN